MILEIQVVHAVIVAIPAFTYEPTPESAADRELRLEEVATVSWEVAAKHPSAFTRFEWVAALSTVNKHETNQALYVQADKCETGPENMRCDNGKARGPFQLHQAACPKLHELPMGHPDALRIGAQCASRQLAFAFHRCKEINKDPIAGMFSGYAGGATDEEACTKSWAGERSGTYYGLVVDMKHQYREAKRS